MLPGLIAAAFLAAPARGRLAALRALVEPKWEPVGRKGCNDDVPVDVSEATKRALRASGYLQ